MSGTKTFTRGFTLIELMIAILIVSIISAIAVPAYNDYVTRSRLSDGVSRLADMRVQMEQYFQDNRRYLSAALDGTCGVAVPTGITLLAYTCVAGPIPPAVGVPTYTVTATGSGSLAGFIFTIDESNTRATTSAPANGKWGPSTGNAGCWVVKPGGGC